MKLNNIWVAIDGPAGSGKSTIARIIAKKKNLLYIDTGAMYRAITLKVIKSGIGIGDIDEIVKILETTRLEIVNDNIFLDGVDVTKEIRDIEVSKYVSQISAIPKVREELVKIQREIAMNNDVIMDGRDIGTKVLKEARYKFFLTASLDERVKRRYKELLEKGYKIDLEEVKNDIINRDRIDKEREVDPLKIADDAIVIDTTNKSIDEVVNEIIRKIK